MPHWVRQQWFIGCRWCMTVKSITLHNRKINANNDDDRICGWLFIRAPLYILQMLYQALQWVGCIWTSCNIREGAQEVGSMPHKSFQVFELEAIVSKVAIQCCDNWWETSCVFRTEVVLLTGCTTGSALSLIAQRMDIKQTCQCFCKIFYYLNTSVEIIKKKACIYMCVSNCAHTLMWSHAWAFCFILG